MFHFYFIIFHFIVRIGIQIHMDRDYTYPLWDIYTGSDSALIYPTCEIYQGWDLCTNKISPQWRCIVEVSMYHTWDWVSMLLYKSIWDIFIRVMTPYISAREVDRRSQNVSHRTLNSYSFDCTNRNMDTYGSRLYKSIMRYLYVIWLHIDVSHLWDISRLRLMHE